MADDEDKTDEDLLREYHLAKNPLLLNVLFSRYADIGFRTAMRYMRNQSDAEDVLQLAFIQFLQNLHFFREGASTVKPWLLKMIVNTSINKLKEEKRRLVRQRNVASERLVQYEKQERNTEIATEQEELKKKIRSYVDTLPEKYRSPIWLVLYEGCSYPEVASVLALPEKTVRTQVARGLEKLREILNSIGSVLSVDLIVDLIANSKLDTAPISVKHIIDSPELYKSISSKLVNTASQSGRIAIAAKTSLFSVKIIIAFVALSSAIISGIYVLKIQEKNTSAFVIKNSKPSSPKEEIFANEDTNRTWSFTNEADRKLPLLLGQWKWSSESDSMVTPVNDLLAISLPIFFQQKPFVIECVMAGISRKDGGLEFQFMPHWFKKRQQLMYEYFFIEKEKHIFKQPSKVSIIMRLYFYNGYICYFRDDKCVTIYKYLENLKAANILLHSVNYKYQKITSFTIDALPEEVSKAIDSISNQTGPKSINGPIFTYTESDIKKISD